MVCATGEISFQRCRTQTNQRRESECLFSWGSAETEPWMHEVQSCCFVAAPCVASFIFVFFTLQVVICTFLHFKVVFPMTGETNNFVCVSLAYHCNVFMSLICKIMFLLNIFITRLLYSEHDGTDNWTRQVLTRSITDHCWGEVLHCIPPETSVVHQQKVCGLWTGLVLSGGL